MAGAADRVNRHVEAAKAPVASHFTFWGFFMGFSEDQRPDRLHSERSVPQNMHLMTAIHSPRDPSDETKKPQYKVIPSV
jgi:hypothetical protein